MSVAAKAAGSNCTSSSRRRILLVVTTPAAAAHLVSSNASSEAALCLIMRSCPVPFAADAAAAPQVSFPLPLYPLVSPDVLVESYEVGGTATVTICGSQWTAL